MNVNHLRRILFAAAAIGLVVACGDSPVEPAQTVDVYTPGNTFSPFSMNVSVGGVVRYNIFGEDHNVIFSKTAVGYPADINIVKDTIVSRTFSTKGTFTYTCTVHPGMNGEIVVQ